MKRTRNGEFARQNRVDARATTQSTIDQADADIQGQQFAGRVRGCPGADCEPGAREYR